MDRTTAISRLRSLEGELRALGVDSLSLFGSTARNDARRDSDIDIVVVLEDIPSGFAVIGRLTRIRDELTKHLGVSVDVLPEPSSSSRLKNAIDKDRHLVF